METAKAVNYRNQANKLSRKKEKVQEENKAQHALILIVMIPCY